MGQRSRKAMGIDEMPTEYVQCRTFGHSWDEFIPTNMRKPSFGFRFSLICATCGTERHDLLDTNGAVANRAYKYPDYYQTAFKADRSEYRIELSSRKRKRARRGALLREFN